MSLRTDTFDLAALRLTSGEGRRLELSVEVDPLTLAGDRYQVTPSTVPVRLDISRTTGRGYALRLRFTAQLEGPCMRCLEPASPSFEVDAREIYQPGQGEELESPYVQSGLVDLAAWSRDALVLALPPAISCRPDCAGLCPICGQALADLEPSHRHESGPDPRWAKLSELRFDEPAG